MSGKNSSRSVLVDCTHLADAVGVDGALGDHEEAGGADGATLTGRLTGAEAAVLLRSARPTGQQGAPHLVAPRPGQHNGNTVSMGFTLSQLADAKHSNGAM